MILQKESELQARWKGMKKPSLGTAEVRHILSDMDVSYDCVDEVLLRFVGNESLS